MKNEHKDMPHPGNIMKLVLRLKCPINTENVIQDELSHTHHKFVRFEVFTAVTMKNAVFWETKSQFIPHRKHITSLLQSPAGSCYVRFEVFTAVTMKNAAFWDI
jgi:hypothetical protein